VLVELGIGLCRDLVILGRSGLYESDLVSHARKNIKEDITWLVLGISERRVCISESVS
jgi:hypothetical protein